MPIVGTGKVAASAMEAARNSVRASYLAMNRALSPEEIAQMRVDMETAALNVLFAHLEANVVVVAEATAVTPGSGTAVVAGTIE